MRKRCLAFLIVLLLIAADMGARPESVVNAYPGSLEDPLFTFVQITDVNISNATSADIVSQAATDINLLNPAPVFVINTGDTVAAPSSINYGYYNTRVADFTPPVYSAIGDHDASISEVIEKLTYESYLGPRNYAFDVAPYHFIVLDSTKPSSLLTNGGGFEEETLTWLGNHLGTVSPTTPIIVFTHHSFWSPMQYAPKENLFCDVENPDEIMNLFPGYNLVGAFSGHAHRNMQYTHHETGTKFLSSGSLSTQVSNTDYSPPGYTIVECYSDRLETYWVPLGGINEYYIYQRQDDGHIVTVAQDYTGDFNGDTHEPIVSAIDYLESIGGGAVVIKEGTYTLGGGLYTTQLATNVWLRGVDRDGVVLKFADGTAMKRIGFKEWGSNNIRVENLTIDGNKQNRDTSVTPLHTSYCGIEIDGGWTHEVQTADGNMSHDIVINNLAMKNLLHRGFVSYAGRRIRVSNCYFENNASDFEFDHWADNVIAENNVSVNSGMMTELNDASNVLIYNNQTTNYSGNYGISVWRNASSSTSSMSGNKILYNRFINHTGTGWTLRIYSALVGGIEVLGNTIDSSDRGIIVVAYGAGVPANTVFNVVADNELINVPDAPHEEYGHWYYDQMPLDGLAFVNITADSISFRALGDGYGYSEFMFEVREYAEGGVIETNSAWTTNRVYTFSRDISHAYAVRCKPKSNSWGHDCPYTVWHYIYPYEIPNPPVFSPIGNKTITADTPLQFTVSATDPDLDPLTYSASGLPTGASFNASTRTFTWTPTADQGGVYQVTFAVSDGTGGIAAETINISALTSALPVFNPIGDKVIHAGWQLQFTVSATDPDLGPLTYSASGLPTGATLDPSTGAVAWTPTLGQEGTYNVTFTAMDVGNETTEETITITAHDKIKALYLWSYINRIFSNESEWERFLELCGYENITTIYVTLDADTIDDLNKSTFPTLITEANSRGMEVHAIMGGGASALDNPEGHRAYIEAILEYNIENPTCRLTGINWDIEPISDYSLYTDYIRTLKTYSYNGETIVSQGLTLSTYVDPPDNPAYREFIHEWDYIALDAYSDTFDNYTNWHKSQADVCEDEGVPFIQGLETAEHQKERENGAYTTYEEGQDAYNALSSQIDAYCSNNYSNWKGQFVHHYKRAIRSWYMIDSVDWPSGEFLVGETVNVNVMLEGDGWDRKAARGIKLEFQDETGYILETSKIVIVPSMGQVQVSLDWTIPLDAVGGDYDVKVTTYDLDYFVSGVRDSLDYVYPNTANADGGYYEPKYNLPQVNTDDEVWDVPLTELQRVLETYPDDSTHLVYRTRNPFPVLDYTDWNNDSFTVVDVATQAGDANGDTVINTADITIIERIIVGLQAATGGADVNRNGQVNTADITKLERIIAGLD
ncbi:putative Ig domain-containing protein [Chloroflexota bacterium]